jgi:hypothetical protein
VFDFVHHILKHLIIIINQVAHNLVSASVSTSATNDLAPASIPAASVNVSLQLGHHIHHYSIILVDQSALELQVSASVSALAVAPVAHPEGTSPLSSDTTMQANLRSTELEQNPSVNCLHIVFSAFADDQQAQQPVSSMFTNAQNTVITGGTFVSLSHRSCK